MGRWTHRVTRLKKHWFFIPAIIGIIFIASAAFAERATVEEMDAISRNWLTQFVKENGDWNGAASPEIRQAEDITRDGLILGRIYSVAPSGFIIVPVLKEMPAVSFYSVDGEINIKENDGAADMIKSLLYNRVDNFIKFYGDIEQPLNKTGANLFGSEHRALRDKYAASVEDFAGLSEGIDKAGDRVGPLLTTVWHQGYPYNMYCPMGDGGRSVVGCVATALGQIMWYWQWPPFGNGTHTYLWDGDYCTGLGGGYITGTFYDVYDYSSATSANVAELSYEAGIAYDMMYGNCASGAYMTNTAAIISDYFRYKNSILRRNRYQYNNTQWNAFIQTEIEAGRPIMYGMTQHAVVCDGWKYESGYNQYHMNYGWGGTANLWYVIDNYHCPVETCSIYDEQIYIGIEPNHEIAFYSDVRVGQAPLTVNFEGFSDLTVDTWDWTFGDGDFGSGQYPAHEYAAPGMYDVDLEIDAGGTIKNITGQVYIVATADTLKAENIGTSVGDTITLIVTAANTVPLNTIKIPIEYSGNITLENIGYTTEGCRTEYFASLSVVIDPFNPRAVYTLKNSPEASAVELTPGEGPLLKVFFEVLSGTPGDTTFLYFDGYSSHLPLFTGHFATYAPALSTPLVHIAYVCGDANGDTDVNILDIVFLVNYKFKGGPAPDPLEVANVNHDADVNILDIVYLINYKFKSGPEPDCGF